MQSSVRQDERVRDRDSLLPIDPAFEDDEIEIDYKRCSLVSGPRVTKYGEMQWEDFQDALDSSHLPAASSSSRKGKDKNGKERPGTANRFRKGLKVLGTSASSLSSTSPARGLPERPSVGSMMSSNQSLAVSALLSARKNLANLVSGSASSSSAYPSQTSLQPPASDYASRSGDAASNQLACIEHLNSFADSTDAVSSTVTGLSTARSLSTSTTSSSSSSQAASGVSSSLSSSTGTASTSSQDRQRLTTPRYLGPETTHPAVSHAKSASGPVGLGLNMSGQSGEVVPNSGHEPYLQASYSPAASPGPTPDQYVLSTPRHVPAHTTGRGTNFVAFDESVFGTIPYRAPAQGAPNTDSENGSYPSVNGIRLIPLDQARRAANTASPNMDGQTTQESIQTPWTAKTSSHRAPSWEQARPYTSEESVRPALPSISTGKREDKVVKGKKSIVKFFKGASSSNTTGSSSTNTPAIFPTPKIPNSAHVPTPHLTPWPSNASGIPRPSRVFPPPPMPLPLPLPSPTMPTPVIVNDQPPLASSPSSALTPRLELRPVSMLFANGLPPDMLLPPMPEPGSSSASSPLTTSCSALAAPSPAATEISVFSHPSRSSYSDGGVNELTGVTSSGDLENVNIEAIAKAVRAEVHNARKAWLVQICELQSQVRELKLDLAQARMSQAGFTASPRLGSDSECVESGSIKRCEVCGCGCAKKGGVMDRGRAKTGGARGVFGSGSLYEWE